MKKILLTLLLLFSFVTVIGQVSTGKETPFNNGIRNKSSQLIITPDTLVTKGVDGTFGHTSSYRLPISNDTFDALGKKLDRTSTTLISGLEIVNNGTTFNVNPGVYQIVDNSTIPYTVQKIAFAGQSNIAPLYARTIVYLNNLGQVVQFNGAAGDLTPLQLRDNLFLGGFASDGVNILAPQFTPSIDYDISGRFFDLAKVLGARNADGNVIAANGPNLQLNKGAGHTYRIGSNYFMDKKSPDVTEDPSIFPIPGTPNLIVYRDGLGGWVYEPFTGSVTPSFWDNGSGVKATVANNKFTIQRVYFFNGTNTFLIFLGQTEYSSLDAAKGAIYNETRLINPATSLATLRCSLVLGKAVTDLTNISLAYFENHIDTRAGGGVGGSGSAQNLQSNYDNSVAPQITTTTALGAVEIRRGSAADTDDVLKTSNGAGTKNFSVAGNGNIYTAAVPSATVFSHYFGETASDGVIRPKTLANVKTEIVTSAAVAAAVPNIVTGTGTTNTISKWTGTNTQGNSTITDTGTVVHISTSNAKLTGGDTTGRNSISNSSSTAYIEMYGQTHAILPNDITLITNTTGRIRFFTNATERVIINEAGNVGIGTTSPIKNLSVGLSAGVGKGISLQDTAGTTEYARFGVVNPTVSNDSFIGSISNNPFSIYTNSLERLRVTNGGDVYIGATVDDGSTSKLQVNGSINVTNAFYRYNNSTGIIGSATSIVGGTSSQLGIRAANEILFATGGTTERMRISATGNVSIGTTIPYDLGSAYNYLTVNGTSGSGVVNKVNNTTSGRFSSTLIATSLIEERNLPLIFYTNNIERLQITNTGNVGIGTTTPSAITHSVIPYLRTDTTERIIDRKTSNDADFRVGIQTSITGGVSAGVRKTTFQTGTEKVATGAFSNGGEMLLLNPSGGFVGVNNPSPTTALGVIGTITATSYSGGATLTGVPTAPTASAGALTTQIANTDFVTTADNLKANINSPTFTGNPISTTPALGDNSTRIATTAFVQNATGGYRVYTALVSQSGTSAPTAIVLRNTLGGTVTWAYTGVGTYTATLTGAFTLDKTAIFFARNPIFYEIGGERTDANTITITTSDGGTGAALNSGLNKATIEFRVYP